MISFRKCPVCKSEQCTKCFSVSFSYNAYLPSEYTIVACDNCGFCFSDSDAGLKAYDEYYKNSNMYSGEQGEKAWEKILYQKTKELLLRRVTKNATIADIGFGKGSLLKYLKREGFEKLYGIDPSQESVCKLKQFGINACIGGVYEDTGKQFEVVMLFNVLEHLYEPRLAIEILRKQIAEDGMLVLAVPVYDRLADDNTMLPNNFNREHINYFSQHSINHLMSLYSFGELDYDYVEIPYENNSKNVLYLGLFKRMKHIEKVTRLFDNKTKDSILEYYYRVGKRYAEIQKKIGVLRQKQIPVAIWGAGENLSNLLATTDLPKCKIVFLVDNNPTKVGGTLGGFTIKAPESLWKFDGTILICSMLYAEEIKKQIQRMGLKSDVVII